MVPEPLTKAPQSQNPNPNSKKKKIKGKKNHVPVHLLQLGPPTQTLTLTLLLQLPIVAATIASSPAIHRPIFIIVVFIVRHRRLYRPLSSSSSSPSVAVIIAFRRYR